MAHAVSLATVQGDDDANLANCARTAGPRQTRCGFLRRSGTAGFLVGLTVAPSAERRRWSVTANSVLRRVVGAERFERSTS